jgi:hypothetical protein
MADYLRIKQILDDAVNGEMFAAHGPFWRSLTRDQFVERSIFGRKLIAKRDDGTLDPEESNLVKALEGRDPFGDDMKPPVPGAFWPRMPFRYPPVPDEKILEIRNWIQAGCPEFVDMQPGWIDESGGGPASDPAIHNGFFRDFDNWAMFNASPQTSTDIDAFFSIAPLYFEFAKNATLEANWDAALRSPTVVDAVKRLDEQQRTTVVQHYGKPVPLLTLLDGFMRFGGDTLPDDPLRPVDVRHNMNGRSMWFFWAAFTDACMRIAPSTSIPADFWTGLSRGILLGLINDGLFRGRFTVSGFTSDDVGREAALQHAQSLAATDLPSELTTRLVESQIFS